MERKTSSPGRIIAGTLAAFLVGCGGGDGDGPAVAPSAAPVVAARVESSAVSSLPAVEAGLRVEVYARVSQPMKLTFGRGGILFVGRHGGSVIHRINPNGHPVSEFGPPMVDPDAVLFDTNGRISGVRNSVLVGGTGVLAAIFPNQRSAVVFNSGFNDVDDMKFDRTGRLVFSDDLPQVLVSNGAAPTVLFATPSRPGSIAIDKNNRIYVALADGTIRIHNADGTLYSSAFATGLAGLDTYLAFGPNPGGSEESLYVLDGSRLLRFDQQGSATVIGSGFSVGPASGTGFIFGPDGALYVSEFNNDRILRIAQ